MAKPPKDSAPSFSALLDFEDEDSGVDVPVQFGAAPPTTPPLPALAPNKPVALEGRKPVFFLLGRGHAGKTVLARWIAGETLRRAPEARFLIGALDPGHRALAGYFEGVQQPGSSDPAEGATWLRKVIRFLAKNGSGGALDFGGGNTALGRLLDNAPELANSMEEDGLAPIATYVLTPSVDDLGLLHDLEARGFQPRATLLVLNLAKAESPADFAALRRHPAYKAALERGAVEIWMPALEPQSVALAIEAKRLSFHEAREGVAESNPNPPLPPFERIFVREWMAKMERTMAPLAEAGWLPWS